MSTPLHDTRPLVDARNALNKAIMLSDAAEDDVQDALALEAVIARKVKRAMACLQRYIRESAVPSFAGWLTGGILIAALPWLRWI